MNQYTIKYLENNKVSEMDLFIKRIKNRWYICINLKNQIHFIDWGTKYPTIRKVYLGSIEASQNKSFRPYQSNELHPMDEKTMALHEYLVNHSVIR